MSLRTIMIFPKFKDMDIIDDIRDRFDPLAKLVRPHITLVLPFEHDMSNEELTKILDNRLSEITPFDLEMHGFNKQAEEFGNYLAEKNEADREEPLTTTQLRRFFGEVKRQQMTDFDETEFNRTPVDEFFAET